jgi:phosphoglycolate phosphatase-like HAD superfamily hydrolase
MSNSFLHPRAALLDIDGTLVDSNDYHARAWVDAFREMGHEIPFGRVRPLIGMGGDKIIPRLTGLDANRGEGKDIAELRGKIFMERYLQHVRAFVRSRALVERMSDEGLRLVIATSAKQEEYEKLVRIADVRDIVDAKTTADDANRSKPDPDIILAALKKSRCPASDTIMLGDTPFDLQAAHSAGVACVAFRSGGWPDADLAGALAVYDDPADLLDRFDESPFARGVPWESGALANTR